MELKNSPERSNGAQEHSTAESGGLSMSPPAFQLMASGDGIIQRQEPTPETTPQAPVPPVVPDTYRDPIANSNLASENIRLLIARWEASDDNQDDRKLAYILATSDHETADTMQGIHEGLGNDYWPSYADTGYWGRGFVQLTHESNYEGMEDDTSVDLTEYPEASLLPAISAIVTVDGMLNGDFTTKKLDTYFPVTENQDGTTTQGTPDWVNARRTVNGVVAADSIAARAQAIYTSIQTFRAGVTDGSITVDLATYLYTQTTHFAQAQSADAIRLLQATGYLDFQSPSFGDDATAEQETYQGDVGETGYVWFLQQLNTPEEQDALRRFQQEFNQTHPLDQPLPENGQLDARTLEALTRAGRIQSGNNMIDYAFHGLVAPINPVTQAWEQYQAQTWTLPQLAARLVSLMPVPTAQDVLTMFDNMGANAAELAYQLSMNAPAHNDLAYFNQPILERMRDLLNASSLERHRIMGRRVSDLLAYTPPQSQHITYVVVSGDTLGAIATRNNMTVDALVAYNNENGNPIANPNAINIGQQILLPNTAYDPNAGSATVELTNYPLPLETPTPVPDVVAPTPTPEASATPEVGQQTGTGEKSLFDRFVEWLASLFGGK